MRSFKIPLYLILLNFIFLSIPAKAQSPSVTFSLSGKVFDQQGVPSISATVRLINAGDSSAVKGSLTDENGQYVFNHLKAGDYIVCVSFVGYVSAQSAAIHLKQSVSVPPLIILRGTGTLADVTVSASRPLIDHQPGKIIVNVEKSILAVGNNALEILDRVPGVSVDQDNHISLRGKHEVVVLINDKPTYLTADQLGNLLSATDGGRISSIEVLSTPPANYGASGSAGLINIKLKKNKDQGLNGNFKIGAGYGHAASETASINLNYSNGKLNMFGALTHQDYKSSPDITINRLVHQDTQVTAYDQLTSIRTWKHNSNLRLGADYDLSAQNTVGIGFSSYLNYSNSKLSDVTTIGELEAPIDSLLHSKTITAYSFKNYSFNLNDRYKLNEAGQTLSFDLDYSRVRNNANTRDTNRFFLSDGTLLHDPQVLTNQTPADIHIYVGKVDYETPLTKKLHLSAGFKASKVSSDNNLQAQVLKNHAYINDTTRTNHFLYKEQIYAGYVNVKGNSGGLEYQAGLRSEFTRSSGDLVGKATTRRKYIDFFPSFSLSQPINGKDNLDLSFSRRIDRPAYDNLNPFKYVLDPYTADIGYAFLNPQYTNAVELGYSHRQAFNLTVGYSRTTYAIMPIVFTQGNISMQTYRNLDVVKSWNIDANVPYSIARWWTGNVDFNGFYNRYKSDTLAASSFRSGKPAFIAKATQILKFGYFSTEVQSNYKSANTEGIYIFKPQFYTDVAISRSVFRKRANISFAVSDVFKTRSIRDESHLLNNDFNFSYRYDSRIFKINFNYKFGNDKLKKHQQRSGAEDEKERVKQSS